MQIDTAGTYTLKYTAEDACGNVTEVTREVVAEVPPTYRTVLYTDGTFIINESSRDQAANEVLHGVATNVYDPFDPNGATDVDKYVFAHSSQQPWANVKNQIITVEVGEEIHPTSLAFWFYGTTVETVDFDGLYAERVTSMERMFSSSTKLKSIDLSNLNLGFVTNMNYLFGGCTSLETVDFSNPTTSAVTSMNGMFYDCAKLVSLDLTNFSTVSVNDMRDMFHSCETIEELDLNSFDTSNVTTMQNMFYGCSAVKTIDLSSFDTMLTTDMRQMFYLCRALQTIYASADFVTDQVTRGAGMFSYMSANLVGGAGTTWSSSNPDNKTYARIDNPPDAPGYFTLKSA